MTAQIPDQLEYDGEALALHDEVLRYWMNLVDLHESPFEARTSANWRGYVAAWRIADGRLYLVGLSGALKDGTSGSLDMLFPGFPRCVFAHWYSGLLKAPRGAMLRYVHMGYGSEYEQDVIFDIERGRVRSVEERNNAPTGAGRGGVGLPSIDALMKGFAKVRRALVGGSSHADVSALTLSDATDIASIERTETHDDPQGGAPALPFGHLNAKWEAFKRSLREGSELRPFWESRPLGFGETLVKSGYASVRNGEIVDRFDCAAGRR